MVLQCWTWSVLGLLSSGWMVIISVCLAVLYSLRYPRDPRSSCCRTLPPMKAAASITKSSKHTDIHTHKAICHSNCRFINYKVLCFMENKLVLSFPCFLGGHFPKCMFAEGRRLDTNPKLLKIMKM
jgi:hypothetical protein